MWTNEKEKYVKYTSSRLLLHFISMKADFWTKLLENCHNDCFISSVHIYLMFPSCKGT